MSTLYLFQAELDGQLDADLETESTDKKPGKKFCCAVCGAYITDDRFNFSINGQQVHRRTNPLDQTFSFGCFSAAPGCAVHGNATDEHSWFHGYRWRFAHCKNCSVQMGWQFLGETDFYGLVLEQLVECDSKSSPGDH